MYYIGIDPGASGAISVINDEGHVIAITDMPTRYAKETEYYKKTGKAKPRKDHKKVVKSQDLFNFIHPYRDKALGFIENVTSRDRDGRGSAFTFGTHFQACRTVLELLGINYYQITPQVWQKHFEFKTGDSKEQSLAAACTLAPEKLLRGPRGGVRDGRTDALLIAHYGLAASKSHTKFWVSRFVAD